VSSPDAPAALIGAVSSDDANPRRSAAHSASRYTEQFAQRRVPYTVDLGFTLIGVSDHTTELLNLMAATQLFFHRNPYLELDRDPDDPNAGRVRYEMAIARDGDLKVTSQPNESNVRSFSGRFVVRGFDLEDLAGAPGEGVVARGAVAGDVVVPGPMPLGRAPGDGDPTP
jgi:hypothetical protein